MKPARLLILPFLLLCLSLQGQELTFSTTSWNFGSLKEADGAVEHDFAFRNQSSRAVRIGTVSVSCSCVQAVFPREEIPVGGTGVLTVRMSPAGAAGKTFRYADVYSLEGKHLGRLTLEADIDPLDMGLEERYRAVLGGPVRALRLALNFGYVREGKPATKEIYLANVADRPVSLEVESSGVQVEAPRVLPAKGETVLKVTLNPRGAYCTFRDELRVRVDGIPAAPIPVTALGLGGEEDPGAALWTSPSEARLRRGRGSIDLGNSGKADLRILGVEVPEGVDVNLKPGTRVAPGKKVKVVAKSALKAFEIRIFTNDPVRPFRELRYKQ